MSNTPAAAPWSELWDIAVVRSGLRKARILLSLGMFFLGRHAYSGVAWAVEWWRADVTGQSCGSVHKTGCCRRERRRVSGPRSNAIISTLRASRPACAAVSKLKSTEADRRAYLRAILVLVFQLATITMAPAQFVNFSQWSNESASERTAYMAGAFDSLLVFGNDEEDAHASYHYQQCVLGGKMTSSELAENVLRFGKSHPSLRTGSVQAVLMKYLTKMCEVPAQQ